MSQSEAEDEQLLGEDHDGGDHMDEELSERGSESEDERDDSIAGERWFRSLIRGILRMPEVSLVQLWSKMAFATERANAFKDAAEHYTEQCATGALEGTTKLKHLVEVLRTQVQARTAERDAAI